MRADSRRPSAELATKAATSCPSPVHKLGTDAHTVALGANGIPCPQYSKVGCDKLVGAVHKQGR